MAKNLNVSVLIDFYGQLLTQKQLDSLRLYYNEDLSLAEIADEMGISRQGVRDNIKRAEAQLFDLEAKLGLAERFQKISDDIKVVEDMLTSDKIDLNEIRNRLKQIQKEV